MWKDSEELIKEIQKEHWTKVIPAQDDFWNQLVDYLKEHILPKFFIQIT